MREGWVTGTLANPGGLGLVESNVALLSTARIDRAELMGSQNVTDVPQWHS